VEATVETGAQVSRAVGESPVMVVGRDGYVGGLCLRAECEDADLVGLSTNPCATALCARIRAWRVPKL
jgi:hypothetical protein